MSLAQIEWSESVFVLFFLFFFLNCERHKESPQTRVLLHWVYSLWVGEELAIERPLPTIGSNGM